MLRPRVLVLLHDPELSGAPRVALEAARLFEDLGWSVLLASPADGPAVERARELGLEVIVVRSPLGSAAASGWAARGRMASGRLRAVLRLAGLLRRGRFDLLWLSSAMAAPAALAGALAGIPVAAHIHEVLPPTRGNRARVALLRRLCRGLAFVAPACAPAFGRRPAGQQRILLPNVLPQPADGPDRDGLRAELGAGSDDFALLAACYLSPRKGIDVLLDAFGIARRERPNLRLWIAGGASPDNRGYAEAMRRRAEDPALGGAVRFLGPRDDVPALMAAADAFVLASRNEALPLSILEALAAGVPVVATDVGSVRWQLAGGRAGLVVAAEDPTALAGAIAQCASDPPAAKARAERARRWAAKRFGTAKRRDALARFLGALGVPGTRRTSSEAP